MHEVWAWVEAHELWALLGYGVIAALAMTFVVMNPRAFFLYIFAVLFLIAAPTAYVSTNPDVFGLLASNSERPRVPRVQSESGGGVGGDAQMALIASLVALGAAALQLAIWVGFVGRSVFGARS